MAADTSAQISEETTAPTEIGWRDLLGRTRLSSSPLQFKEMFQADVISAETNSTPKGMRLIGLHYRLGHEDEGFTLPIDLSRALYWYEKSAEAGDSIAQFNTACLLYKQRSEFDAIKEPYKSNKAARYMLMAAKSGLLFAQLDMSSYYRYGIGVEISDSKADHWLSQSRRTAIDEAPSYYASGDAGFLLFPEDTRELFWTDIDVTIADYNTEKGRNLLMARYLRLGFCSPPDSESAHRVNN